MGISTPPVAVRLDPPDLEALEHVSAFHGQPKSAIVRLCVRALLRPDGRAHKLVNTMRDQAARARRR